MPFGEILKNGTSQAASARKSDPDHASPDADALFRAALRANRARARDFFVREKKTRVCAREHSRKHIYVFHSERAHTHTR